MTVGNSMRYVFAVLIRDVTIGVFLLAVLPRAAFAATSEPADHRIDPAPCVAAVMANDDDQIVAICSPLIDSEKTVKADRVKALIARAGVYDRKDQIDRAIGDYDTALRL